VIAYRHFGLTPPVQAGAPDLFTDGGAT